MTWAEFKEEAEKLGVRDDDEVKWVYGAAPYIHPPSLERDDAHKWLVIESAYEKY